MKDTNKDINQQGSSVFSRALMALRRVSDLMKGMFPGNVAFDSTKTSFVLNDFAEKYHHFEIHGNLINQKINLQCRVLRLTKNKILPTEGMAIILELFQEFSLVAAPRPVANDEVEIWIELRGDAKPMGPIEEKAFLSKITQLKDNSRKLQNNILVTGVNDELDNLYQSCADLTPISRWQWKDPAIKPLWDWAVQTIDFLRDNSSIALAGEDPLTIRAALAILARVAKQFNTSLGILIVPQCGAEKILKIVDSAPGAVVIPAIRISVGAHLYDFSQEIRSMLASLTGLGKPVIFSGNMKELQNVFHGGQGGEGDPLHPIVRHIPEVPLPLLIRFAVREEGGKTGGLTTRREQDICHEVGKALVNVSPENSRSLLAAVTARSVHEAHHTGKSLVPSLQQFVANLQGCTETLVGMPVEVITGRSVKVMENFTRAFTGSDFLTFFEESLIGQADALAMLQKRLCTEALTRPDHQPIRYCAQGTPGNGKSESAVLLARKLAIPYVNIDAASMTDFHTASAQLLGSSRGLVGSYQAGRLESIAREYQGAVVEISDLDHAPVQARKPMADLFLQLLESGEAQSATGARFSCANLIFAFTINLPNGMDEEVHKRYGFGPNMQDYEVRDRVSSEIKLLFSSAFLSRIGGPILFRELSRSALIDITGKAMLKAIETALERLGQGIPHVIIADNVVETIIGTYHLTCLPSNARSSMELGRNSVIEPLLQLVGNGTDWSGKKVLVDITSSGNLDLRLCG